MSLLPLAKTVRLSLFGVLLGALGALLAPPAQGQMPSADENVTVDPSLYEDLNYRMVGPSRGGRVTAVTGHPDHPFTFYMGSVGGGVWKTTNYGNTWHNVTDGTSLKSGAIGSIQVAPSDTSVLYAGTGSDGIRSNVITGRGMYKSTDAGETWEFIGLEDGGQIGRLAVDPTDPDRVFAAATGSPFGKNEQRGVFRSTDGGETWEKVLYASDSTGAYGLAMNPENPQEIYAALWRGQRKPWTVVSGCEAPCKGGIWKSTDGGDNWRQVMSAEEMPDDLIGKIDLSVSPANPERVYAVVEAKPAAEGLYRSDDRGETWELINDRYDLMERPFYYTNVTAHPTDADGVFVNAESSFFESTDGGESFARIPTPHGDNHNAWINPENPDILIQSNDGGANVSLDGGDTWSTQQNQPTAELYQVDVDNQFPYRLYAGQQDNSTISVPSLPATRGNVSGPEGQWEAVGGCETGPAVPHPENANTVYANCKGRFGAYSRVDGQEENYWVGAEYIYGHNPAELQHRFQRTVPIEVSPNDPDVVYNGSQYVHRTTNGGESWERISPDLTTNAEVGHRRPGEPITWDITGEEYFSTTYVIQESPHNSDVIWTGSFDGLIHVTENGGETWSDVTPEGLPKWGRVNAIEISPHQPGTAYASIYRFQLNDFEPYVYKTTDYGASWTRLTTGDNGIPADHPVRVVREDPERPGLLYAGTEFGMYVSFDDGANWQPFQQDLPTTPITDIELHRGDLVLSTMGRGFWVMDNLSPLRQLNQQVAEAETHLFEVPDQYRMRYRAPGGYGSGDAPHEPEYPPPGVMIDYYFEEEPAEEVRLEILDESGTVIQGYSSAADGYRYEQQQGMRDPEMVRVGGEKEVPKGEGMHRFVWDMSHAGPVVPEAIEAEEGTTNYGQPEDEGPLAAPGTYQARLKVGDQTVATRSFELMIDPRVAEDGTTVADLEAQEELNLEIRDALSRAHRLAADVVRSQERVQTASGDHAGLHEELTDLEASLLSEREPVSYPEPKLLNQISYLYGMTTSADQKPGEDAYVRLEQLQEQLSSYEQRLSGLTGRMDEAVGEEE
jgi:photosystem II stability/assembly factor-like uncharacterized protein